jgi:hypothetical protein
MFLLKNVLVNSKATRLALKEKPDFSARFCSRGKPKEDSRLSRGLRYAMPYQYPEGVYLNMGIVAALAVGFIIVGSLVTRWKEK